MILRRMLLLSIYFISSVIVNVNAAGVDRDSQTITIALEQEPPKLNSMKSTDEVSFMVLGHVKEGLVRYDRRGRIVPGVAEKWELRDDGATFWLRKDARWNDGKVVTAQDFVFAWQNAVSPEMASEYAFILYPIKNAELINQAKLDKSELGVKAVDDYTLEVSFEKPCGYFLSLTAFATYFPVRADMYEKSKGRYAADATDMFYNGPFYISSWVHGASLKMERNKYYWDQDKINLKVIDAKYITSDTTARLNLFKDDNIVLTQLDGETMKNALNQRLKIRKFADGTLFWIEFNHRQGSVSKNINFRKALQYVFDSTEFVNKVLATPGNVPGHSLIPSFLSGVSDKFVKEYPLDATPQDIAKAKKLLERARLELGLTKFPPLVLLASDSPTAAKQAEYLQSVFSSTLGLEIKIDKQIFKQRLQKMTAGEFDLVLSGWAPDFDDPFTYAGLFASWNENNRGRYASEKYDQLVRQVENTSDNTTRMKLMSDIQNIVFEDVVILPLYERGRIYLQHPKLRGVIRRVIGPDPDYTYSRIR